MKYDTIIFIGRSGSGKGTQAILLEEKIKISREEVFRVEIGKRIRLLEEENRHTYSLSNNKIKEGELIPEFLVTWILTDEIIKNIEDGKKIIIDGYPRSFSQAKTLDDILNFYNHKKVAVIYLKLIDDDAEERLLKRGRSDDFEKAIDKRFNWFDENLEDIFDFFKEKEKYEIIEINGSLAIEEIHKDICKKLEI